MMKSISCVAAVAFAATLAPVRGAAADCDRACLRSVVTQYLDAFVAHRPNAAFAPGFKYIEDTVETKPGDGFWKEATKLRPYRIDVLDARQGIAGTMAIIEVNGAPAMVSAAATVIDRRIVKLETLVAHNRKEGLLFDIANLEKKASPLGAIVSRAERTPRDEAIRAAERYPAGLKAGSFVAADVPFADDAYRFENGQLMAGAGCTFMKGCEHIKTEPAPKLAGLTYRVIGMDEDTGVVWLDENFGPGSVPRGDGRTVLWTFEAFKVYGGQIHAVEAFMKAVPAPHKPVAAAEQVAPRLAGYVAPRTPWGDPDLNGVWPDIDMVRVPVQRAPQYGTRLFMTPEEHAAVETREQAQIKKMADEGAGGATGAPGWWTEWGTSQTQTSLVVDPPDGRLPPLTSAGRARTARAPRGTLGGAELDSPADFTYWERCISRGVLGSTLPVLYNSGIDITQGPGYVGIRYEMIHDFRIIPLDGRPHLSPRIQQYMGDARAHWDGDTLVVETTNFTDKIGTGLSGGGTPNSTGMRLIEGFTRVAPDRIRYEATVDDPQTWTAPWTVAFPLTRAPSYGMFEYACHEGNHGMLNALSGSRAEDEKP